MSTAREPEPTDSAVKSDANEKNARGIVRFAQYTSPIMLAMLASAGKDAALAVSA